MTDPGFLLGMRIVTTPMARDIRTEFKVQRLGGNRRRKRWFVQRVEINRPAVLQSGNTLFMHPDLFALLKEQTHA